MQVVLSPQRFFNVTNFNRVIVHLFLIQLYIFNYKHQDYCSSNSPNHTHQKHIVFYHPNKHPSSHHSPNDANQHITYDISPTTIGNISGYNTDYDTNQCKKETIPPHLSNYSTDVESVITRIISPSSTAPQYSNIVSHKIISVASTIAPNRSQPFVLFFLRTFVIINIFRIL